MKDVLVTKEGLEKLQQELDHLRNVRRPAVIARIQAAKELGDLSENADYDDARNEQSFVEGRIQELEEMLKRAKVVDHKHSNTVQVGSNVTVSFEREKLTYTIVGSTESDPSRGKISSESPIGKALLGQPVDSQVSVRTPAGEVSYKILKID